MKLSFTTLDVFTSTRYAGNPLAIISVPQNLKASLTQTQKQAIAAEFNLSEIVLHLTPDFTEPSIDIFTPHAEVPFAGHPTIGTAWYLLCLQKQSAITALLEKAGRIPISAEGNHVKAVAPQNFHVHSVTFTSELTPEPAPCVSIVNGMTFILVALPDLPTLAKASTNLQSTRRRMAEWVGGNHVFCCGWRG
jgi:PhzF family phenazine biosynthesis protein